MYLTGGTIYSEAYDDAINSSGNMTISGGYVYGYSRTNDGLDANGNMYIKGGCAAGFSGSTQGAEAGIDIDEQHNLTVTGGYVFGIGARTDSKTSGCTQTVLTTSGSCSSGQYFVVYNSSGSSIFAVKSPVAYSGGTILTSAPTAPKSVSASSVSGTATNGFIVY